MAANTEISWTEAPLPNTIKLADVRRVANQLGLELREHNGQRYLSGFTFNPWIGCTKVDEECRNCYAKTQEQDRWKRAEWGPGKPRKPTSVSYWRRPEQWNRLAQEIGIRLRVFCGSLCDWADAEFPAGYRVKLWNLIRSTPHLDWLLLTKRAERILGCLPDDWGDGWENVWLGTSVGYQGSTHRAHTLAQVPAKLRWLSVEPLIGQIDELPLAGIHWVVCGGESGPGARPMHPNWARSIRDQCQAAGVPFLFKQWGAWLPEGQ